MWSLCKLSVTCHLLLPVIVCCANVVISMYLILIFIYVFMNRQLELSFCHDLLTLSPPSFKFPPCALVDHDVHATGMHRFYLWCAITNILPNLLVQITFFSGKCWSDSWTEITWQPASWTARQPDNSEIQMSSIIQQHYVKQPYHMLILTGQGWVDELVHG